MQTKKLRPAEILLHVGLAKTGTTSIQQCCLENASALLQQGIFYPRTGLHGPGHQMFGLAALADHQRNRDVVRHRSANLHKLLHGMLAEFQDVGKIANQVLLSSERFGSLDLNAIEQFSQHVSGTPVHPIIYLRRQDLMAESLLAQGMRVRGRNKNNRPIKPGRGRFPILNFRSVVDRWSQVFGRDRVIVRTFDKRKNGRDVVTDFLDAIGASSVERKKSEYRLNTKLSRDALEYLYFHTDLVYDTSEYQQVQRKLVEYSRLHPTPVEFRNFYSPQRRIELLDKYAAANRSLANECFGRDELFSGPYPSIDDPWEEYPGLSDVSLKDIQEFLNSGQPPQSGKTLKSRIRNGIKSIHAIDWFRRSA